MKPFDCHWDKAIRRRINDNNEIYLSFDDGPDPEITPDILNILKSAGAKATFFIIAEKLRGHFDIIQRIQKEGHSIGNHSLDHNYRNYFKSTKQLKLWILASEKKLQDHNINSIGFRAPAGIQTPPLHRALSELNIPLIHWNYRFYDSLKPLTQKQVGSYLKRAKSGDILLLHDHARFTNKSQHIINIENLVRGLKNLEFNLAPITL